MISISTNDPILRVEELQTKFDLGIVSNSLIKLLGSYLEARIVQQLHYWTVQQYGQVLNGLRWIYKPVREWLSETLIGFTSWQLRTAIASLIEKGILLREHLFKEHHGNNFAPKNRTYYYSLNYKGLEEFAQQYQFSESLENARFVSSTKQFCENSEKQFCESTQNNTKNTSTKNSSKDISLPTLPCERESQKPNNQDKQQLSNRSLVNQSQVNSANFQDLEPDTSSAHVDEKINQYISTELPEAQLETEELQKANKPSPKLKATLTKQKRENKAPWQDETEKSQFYRALIQALPIVANSHSPQGLAKTIIAQLKRGEEHSYWDDFQAGLPIGTSTQPEWEIEPGVPYPMFVEYLTEKIKRGDNSQSNEQARNEVFRILDRPRQAKAFWGEFKRSVVNVSRQVSRDRALGVSYPSTPVWTRERIEPSLSEAAAAGEMIAAVNGTAEAAMEAAHNPALESEKPIANSQPVCNSELSSDPWMDEKGEEEEEEETQSQPKMRELLTDVLGECNQSGVVKAMPKGSGAEVEAASRAGMKSTTAIRQMSIAEINDYLADPILRKELMPQLMRSDYEFVTNEYGDIIGVKRPKS